MLNNISKLNECRYSYKGHESVEDHFWAYFGKRLVEFTSFVGKFWGNVGRDSEKFEMRFWGNVLR